MGYYIGYQLRKIRKDLRMLRQRELAAKAQMHPTDLSRYETNSRECSEANVIRLAQALDVDPAILLIDADTYGSRGKVEKLNPRWTDIDTSDRDEVNRYLSVMTDRPKPPWSDLSPDTYLSQRFTVGRLHGTNFPPHTLVRKGKLELRTLYGHFQCHSEGWKRFLTHLFGLPGARLMWKPGLDSAVLDPDVGEEIIKELSIQDEALTQFANTIREHRRKYVPAFHSAVASWNHYDICPKSSLEQFAIHGKLPRDNSLPPLGALVLKEELREQCLVYLEKLLLKYEDTYQIGLYDDLTDHFDPLVRFGSDHYWALKLGTNGQRALLWEEWPLDDQGRKMERDYRVNQESLIDDLFQVFTYVWMCYPAKGKLTTDKESVIDYLRFLRTKIPATSRN